MHSPRSIEFVGPPGAGKSTISTVLMARLLPHAESAEPLHHGRRVRIMAALRFALLHPVFSMHVIRGVIVSRQRTMRDFVLVTLNLLYQLSTNSYSGKRVGALRIRDQGIFQAFWSTAYSADKPAAFASHASRLLNNATEYVEDAVVVVVHADWDTVTRRWGHERQHRSRLEKEFARDPDETVRRADMASMSVRDLLNKLEQRKIVFTASIDNSHEGQDSVVSLAEAVAGQLGNGFGSR